MPQILCIWQVALQSTTDSLRRREHQEEMSLLRAFVGLHLRFSKKLTI